MGQRSGGHHRSFGSVLGFVGPLFWPYAYNDFVDYTFSPYAYDTFWPYAYDDLYQGIYGNYAPGYYANEEMKTPMRTRARRHQGRLMRMQLERRDRVEEGRLRRPGPH